MLKRISADATIHIGDNNIIQNGKLLQQTVPFKQLNRTDTATVSRIAPDIYSQDGKGKEAKVFAILRNISSGWKWYVLEASGDECFGLVEGFENELGYFTLDEFFASLTVALTTEIVIFEDEQPTLGEARIK